MVVSTKPITEEMLIELDQQGIAYEVINGELVEVELGGEEHGRIEFLLMLLLGGHVVNNKLGMLYPGDTSFVLQGEPGNIILERRPDIGFVKEEHRTNSTGYIYRAPDLAIEIISPSQTYKEIRDKVTDYLANGTVEVWIVITESRQLEIHTADDAPQIYGVEDIISDRGLLPGLSLELKAVFAE